MKKAIILSMALLSLVACSTDETQEPGNSIQKTSVLLNVTQESPSTTAKQVKRGTIYAWVNSISLNAKNDATNTNVSELFNLVPNSQTGADSAFSIDNVLVGATTFTATSTTDSAQKYVLAPTSGTTTSVLAGLKANNPYVLYTSPEVKQVISGTAANTVTIPMNTKNGRILSVFQLEDNTAFRNGFKATVTAKADGESITGSAPVQNSGIVYFEWSNSKSIGGAKVIYTIDVTPINNSNNVHNIYTVEQIIEASTSISCTYIITKDKAPVVSTKIDNLSFSFQKWEEGECTTCKN